MQKKEYSASRKATKIMVAVSNDLSTDQRVHKVCTSLLLKNTEMILVGRRLADSMPLERPYKTIRLRLLFTKGPLFYACYNLRLFFFLLFSRFDVVVANDLDTLAACYLAAKIKARKIAYDSHEYFTEVPELQNRPFVQSIWKGIEKFIFPKLETIYTVNQSIASLYEQQYNKKITVIRNVAPRWKADPHTKTNKKAFPAQAKPYVILQGAGININRGAEELVSAFQYIDRLSLLIVGNGDVMPELKKRIRREQTSKKVFLIGKKPYQELMHITADAFLGVSLDKDSNLNYRFSLPNKLFDYIQAGIPVLTTKLPEIERIVRQYDIGGFIENHEPHHIADQINAIFHHREQHQRWKENTRQAARSLCWENEEKKLLTMYEPLLS